MSRFAVFVDENSESSHTKVSRPGVHSHPERGIVGKSFNTNKNVLGGVPRKALGDVNRNLLPDSGKSQDLKKPVQKMTQSNAVNECQQKKSEMKQEAYDEIESMHPYNEEKEDDFEDLYPKAERPSTHISDFFNWRPQSMFSMPESISPRDPEDKACAAFDLEEEPVREMAEFEIPEEEIPDDLFTQLF